VHHVNGRHAFEQQRQELQVLRAFHP
jgi:hypothetical protein